MPDVQIFVSYISSSSEPGAQVAQQLLQDLQAAGGKVVTADDSIADDELVEYLDRQLPDCQYFLLVQTPSALQSLRVQTSLNLAFSLVAQQRMRGVLHFLTEPAESEAKDLLGPVQRSFDAGKDYPQARDALLQELGLLKPADPTPAATKLLTPSLPAHSGSASLTSDLLQAPAPLPESKPTMLLSPQPVARASRVATPLPHSASKTSGAIPPTSSLARKVAVNSPLVLPPPVPASLDRPRPLPWWQRSRSRRLVIGLAAVVLLLALVSSLLASTTSLSRISQNSPTAQPTPTPGRGQLTPTATAIHKNKPTPTATVAAVPTRSRPTPTPTPTQTPFLAADTFHRANQQGWGNASDGQAWGADATNTSLFSIRQDSGVITSGHNGQHIDAILGPTTADAEIFLTGKSSELSIRTNFGPVLRWVSPTVFYKAFIDGRAIVLYEEDNDGGSNLATIPFSAQNNQYYNFLFRIQGNTLSARVWLAGTPEPSQWMITVQDGRIQSGRGGMRVTLDPGNTCTFTAFQETALP
jgi:hypothetical protein